MLFEVDRDIKNIFIDYCNYQFKLNTLSISNIS